VLLDHDPGLSKTIGPAGATPLISAATRGHTEVVDELLSKDCSLLEIPRSNGKNALHLAARQGHVEIVKSLLRKDAQLARRTYKKGQTALHMAVKGQSCEAVKLLLDADAAIVMLPDKKGNTALHVATRKKRVEVPYLGLSCTFLFKYVSFERFNCSHIFQMLQILVNGFNSHFVFSTSPKIRFFGSLLN